jgi:hypothetical protein
VVGLGEQLLALHPDADAPVDFPGGRVRVRDKNDGASVVLSLHQAVDELHFVGADHGRGLFQPDVQLEPSGQEVVVLLPPAGGSGLAGKCQQSFAFDLVGDAVQGEEIGYIALPGGAAPAL